jgi:chemotaxis signal transduction protein
MPPAKEPARPLSRLELQKERRRQRVEEEERREEVALPILPDDSRKIPLDNYLFFSVSGMRFCTPLVRIVSIVNVEDALLRLDEPMALPSICRGFVRYRRSPVPLLDLRPKLGLQHEDIPEGAIGLMVDFGVSFLALMVDFVQSLEKGSQGYLLPLPVDISELGDQFLSGFIEHPRGGAFLIDMMNILTDSDIEELSEVLIG